MKKNRRHWIKTKILAAGLAGLLIFSTLFAVTRVNVGLFSTGSLTGWEKKSFKGETLYTLKQDDGNLILLATSNATASGLVKRQSINLKQTPLLHWRWKIVRKPEKRNERSRQGDDYAARVYVIKSGGLAFW